MSSAVRKGIHSPTMHDSSSFMRKLPPTPTRYVLPVAHLRQAMKGYAQRWRFCGQARPSGSCRRFSWAVLHGLLGFLTWNFGNVAAAQGSQCPARSIRCAPVLGMTTPCFTGCSPRSQSLRGETNKQGEPMNNKPAHEIKNGGVKVTIWQNEDQGKTRYSVTVSRSYKAGEEWKQTTSFFKSHLSKLTAALEQAAQWIAEREPAASEA